MTTVRDDDDDVYVCVCVCVGASVRVRSSEKMNRISLIVLD